MKGKGKRRRSRQGGPSDSDAGLTLVKGTEGKKIGQEKLQTTVQFGECLGQADRIL